MTITVSERGQCIACHEENVHTYVLCSCVIHKMCTACWRDWLIVNCEDGNNRCPRCKYQFPLIDSTSSSTMPVCVLWVLSLSLNILIGEFLCSTEKPCTFVCFSVYQFGVVINALHALHLTLIGYVSTLILLLHLVSIGGTLWVFHCFFVSPNQLLYLLYIALLSVIYIPVIKEMINRCRNHRVLYIKAINKVILLPH
jgi:hypothetical protein